MIPLKLSAIGPIENAIRIAVKAALRSIVPKSFRSLSEPCLSCSPAAVLTAMGHVVFMTIANLTLGCLIWSLPS